MDERCVWMSPERILMDARKATTDKIKIYAGWDIWDLPKTETLKRPETAVSDDNRYTVKC